MYLLILITIGFLLDLLILTNFELSSNYVVHHNPLVLRIELLLIPFTAFICASGTSLMVFISMTAVEGLAEGETDDNGLGDGEADGETEGEIETLGL